MEDKKRKMSSPPSCLSSPDCPQQSLCCFNGCSNVCIPEQSSLKQGSKVDIQSDPRKRNHLHKSRRPKKHIKGSPTYIGTASDGRRKKHEQKKTNHNSQGKDPLTGKSPAMPVRPGSRKKQIKTQVQILPETIKSSHVELVPNDRFSSSPVEITPSSFVTNNFSPFVWNNLPASPTFQRPGTESEPSGATLDVTGHKSGNEVVHTLDVNEHNVNVDEVGRTGGENITGTTNSKLNDEAEDKNGNVSILKYNIAKPKEKYDLGVKIKATLTEKDLSRIRERFAKFQNSSASSLTKSTFEQVVDQGTPSKPPNSSHQNSQPLMMDQKRPKRKLPGGSIKLVPPQEEYEYIDYPATPPPLPQPNSPCPEPWKSHCRQRNDTCWVPVIFLFLIFTHEHLRRLTTEGRL